MVPAAGEDGVVVERASLTVEIACTDNVVTINALVEDPAHPEVIASTQAFHLRRGTLNQFRFENVVRQAVGHAAMRAPPTMLMARMSAMQLLAIAANLLRKVPGGNDAGNARTEPAREVAAAAGQRPELVVGEPREHLPPQE